MADQLHLNENISDPSVVSMPPDDDGGDIGELGEVVVTARFYEQPFWYLWGFNLQPINWRGNFFEVEDVRFPDW